MSLTSRVPVSSSVSSDASQVQAVQGEHAEYKGFADIVEYHMHGSSSRAEIIPTAEFVPGKPRKGTSNSSTANAYKDYALVLRRVWEQHKRTLDLVRLDLEIQSERLCQAYREIVADSYEDCDLTTCPIKIKTPFRDLFFHRDAIKALAEDETLDAKLRRDVQVLNDFIDNNGLISSIVHDYNKFVPEGKIPGEILWTIFRPNGLVVVNADGIRECWICRNILIHKTFTGYNWVMVGLRVGTNGFTPGLEMKYCAFPQLGQKLCAIADLPVVPVEYCQDWPEVKEMLLKRSSHLQKILGPGLDSFAPQMYNGATWDHDYVHFNTLVDTKLAAEQIDERIMVDYQGMRKRNAQPPPGFMEMVRIRSKQTKSKTSEKPRGMLSINGDVLPHGPGLSPGTGMPPMGHPAPMPGKPLVYPYPNYPPPQSRHPQRRGRKARDYPYESDSESDWELMGFDSPRFDREGNADIMEFKAFGNAQEVKEVVDTHENDLEGLCRLCQECYNITEEEFWLLFPSLVPGFGLSGKKWFWVLSDELQDIKWNTAAFEALQLEGGTKDLIQALVKGHKTKAKFDDVVPGKGQGLVFLLHGKPGLGKTLTAESVADYLERPLYTIEGGELSTNAADLELDLDSIFELTRRWDAVMLLDEADVLLCKRKSSEMDRNAVVAVFLRKIEYLQGVLFLTTNRRQDFDDAFKSRIHLTVSYPDLSEAAQSAIWKRLIATNKEIKVDNLWVDEAFTALGKLGLNGRTIRNFLRTAVSFAHSKDEALGVRHVLEIIRTELKGEGFNVFSLTSEEHAKLAKTNEALSDLQRLVESGKV